jgi:hypothetical protein
MYLDEKVLAIEASLGSAGIPHALGGALALAYYATPRGTHDIDLNVFVGVERAEEVLAALVRAGVSDGGAASRTAIQTHGQVRLFWDHTPVDLSFQYDPLHESCMKRRLRVPFGEGATIHVLSAEDLVVFKAIFDRAKDWQDIEDLLFALGGDFDASYAKQWLVRILAEDDHRLERFEALLARA